MDRDRVDISQLSETDRRRAEGLCEAARGGGVSTEGFVDNVMKRMPRRGNGVVPLSQAARSAGQTQSDARGRARDANQRLRRMGRRFVQQPESASERRYRELAGDIPRFQPAPIANKPDGVVTLLSQGDIPVYVTRYAAELSGALRKSLRGGTDTVPLPTMDFETLGSAMSFCTHYRLEEQMQPIPTSGPFTVKPSWYAEDFFLNMTERDMRKLIAAAISLDIAPLVTLLRAKLAQYIS